MTRVGSSEVVGRDEELAAIAAFIGRDLPQPTSVLALEGEAGIGKSKLFMAGLEGARDMGLRVLLSRPVEVERDLPYVVLGDLLEGVIDDLLPALSPPRRGALEIALVRRQPGKQDADPLSLGVALRDVFQLLAARAPVLVAIDDAQWSDELSLAGLEFALRRSSPDRVLVLLARRGATRSRIENALHGERLTVGPLSLGATQKLLQQRFGAAFTRPAILRIHEASAGNPFFALELARTFNTGLDLTEPLTVPSSIEDLLAAKLQALPASTRIELLVVAAHGRPPANLTRRNLLEKAFAEGILEESDGFIRFSHPLLASALLHGSTPADRRAAHRRLAKVVADPVSRARHLALSTDRPDDAIAAALEGAALAAYGLGATMVSAELGELAFRLTPVEDAEERRRRLLVYAERLSEVGDGARAIAALEEARKATPPGPGRAQITVELAALMSRFTGRSQEAILLCREALEEAELNDTLRATIYLTLAGLVMVMEDQNTALEDASLAVQAASRVGDPALRAKALSRFGFLHFRSGHGIAKKEMDEAHDLERAVTGWPRHESATWTLIHQLVWSGDLDRARGMLYEVRGALAERDDPGLEQVHWYLAILEWRAGNWSESRRHAADSLRIRNDFGVEGQQPQAELPAALIAAHMGMIDEARSRSLRMLQRAESEGILIAQSGHRWVLGFIELSLGDPARALGYLRAGWELRDSVGLLEPGHRLELADTLEALIAVGELDEAERKLEPWEERALALDRSWAMAITARCRALLLAARGDTAGARRHFDRALQDHARTLDPFQHGRTLLALGAIQRRARQRAAARGSLEQAAEIFESLPAPLWTARARAEIARVGGRPPSDRDELTEAERRVAELVAEGRTNQEVAASLFLGERTVASHLTHIYAKLGIRSRTELARRLH
ncbi:MAG TPA: AAA family ATPase [Candidatus Micrarchaeaceae archaeon]|nr:AAA family ATPase [Candidatus Micrarchaeaceae archaeon]